ncbi:DMT family transporter [Oscillospiraceae bacterium MB08-C2-2]|nr:DMT family transporter [Oscillospiraceae bacterium MB08-C2-2]
MKSNNQYHIYALTTIVFWSLAFVLTRLAMQYFTAFSLGFLRYFIASCTLLLIAIATKMQLPHKKDLLWFVLAGALGFFIYMIAFNQGQKSVTATTGSIVIATVPVLTALIARVVYDEKLSVSQWLGIGVEFAGVAVLTLLNGVLSVNIGMLWLFLAALSLSLYNLLQRKLTKSYTALQTSGFSIFFGTILLSVFLPDSVKEASNAPWIQWVYLIILGIFSSAIAYVTWSKAFAKAQQTSQVSNYMFITPFLTSILGFLIAGETPEPATFIGGGIIMLGIFIFNFGSGLCKRVRACQRQ